MRACLVAVVLFGLLALTPGAQGQWKQPPSTGSPEYHLPDRTKISGQSGMGPLLTAKLVDEDKNAKQQKAVIEVSTEGVELVDSAEARDPKLDEAHIQYRLDEEPARNSTSKIWTFENLSPGEHKIHVNLASNDNRRIGEGTTLKVRIPARGGAR